MVAGTLRRLVMLMSNEGDDASVVSYADTEVHDLSDDDNPPELDYTGVLTEVAAALYGYMIGEHTFTFHVEQKRLVAHMDGVEVARWGVWGGHGGRTVLVCNADPTDEQIDVWLSADQVEDMVGKFLDMKYSQNGFQCWLNELTDRLGYRHAFTAEGIDTLTAGVWCGGRRMLFSPCWVAGVCKLELGDGHRWFVDFEDVSEFLGDQQDLWDDGYDESVY